MTDPFGSQLASAWSSRLGILPVAVIGSFSQTSLPRARQDTVVSDSETDGNVGVRSPACHPSVRTPRRIAAKWAGFRLLKREKGEEEVDSRHECSAQPAHCVTGVFGMGRSKRRKDRIQVFAMSSATMETPWLDEVSAMSPYTYNVTMNAEAARRRDLEDGDPIEIESSYGHRVMGTLKLRRGQHPETLGIMGTAGHWAKGQPIARGKGTNFNFLMEARLEECDPVTLNLELCVRAKVKKLGRT